MVRALSAGFLLLGLGLLGVAALWYFTPTHAPGVTADEPEREYPEVAAGQSIVVSFAIRNPTRHVARIVGLPDG